MKTGKQIIEAALRRIGVVAEDEAPTADQFATGKAVLDGLSAEIEAEAPAPWSVVSGVPDKAYNHLVMLLAVDLAAYHGLPAIEPRGKALARVLATVRQYQPYDCTCRAYPCKCCMWDYV